MTAPRLGAVEAGGTKVVCVVGDATGRIAERARIPTTGPDETLAAAVAFFADRSIEALGIASFGPLELREGHPRHGWITATPKPGWRDVDLVGTLARALGVPVAIDTDVNGAALAEGALGAARGTSSHAYVTVGTGIGGGAVVDGRTLRGLVHPELGHVAVPRAAGDGFAGACPFHGDCLEGMASGPALAARFGAPAERLAGGELDRAVGLAAWYLAAGLRSLVYVLAPERIVLGGGVAALPGLLPRLREQLRATLAGYPGLPEHETDDFVVPAALGADAGPIGALLLAARA